MILEVFLLVLQLPFAIVGQQFSEAESFWICFIIHILADLYLAWAHRLRVEASICVALFALLCLVYVFPTRILNLIPVLLKFLAFIVSQLNIHCARQVDAQ
jgi:hypothetical protein